MICLLLYDVVLGWCVRNRTVLRQRHLFNCYR
nr:MAG TPA: hypothetical protein [Caudoviricetes sp.]